jgi:hypothetical protein
MQPFIYEGIVAMVQGGCSLAEQNQRGTNWSNSGKFLQKKQMGKSVWKLVQFSPCDTCECAGCLRE